MSTVGSTFTFVVDKQAAAASAERRRLPSVWRCGADIFADVRVFRAINDGKRSVNGEVFYRSAIDAVLSRHAAFFAPLGLARTGQFVPRDPIRVPTFGATPERSNFVWTVPKGHEANDADRAVFTRVAEILAAYSERAYVI